VEKSYIFWWISLWSACLSISVH